jgi:hypothetical protein
MRDSLCLKRPMKRRISLDVAGPTKRLCSFVACLTALSWPCLVVYPGSRMDVFLSPFCRTGVWGGTKEVPREVSRWRDQGRMNETCWLVLVWVGPDQ